MSKTASDTVVETSCGKVRGERRDRVIRFRGIPYAEPVSGGARFKPAKPAKSWSGTFDALNLGPACPQNRNATMGLFALPEIQALVGPAITINQPMDENCLALNVWTPSLELGATKKPVMVWLHGGGFFAGSSGSQPYDGEHLAQNGDVVVVSLNHRLNVFGFLQLSEIAGDEYRTGNVGLLDIVLALHWVRDNIAHFGGDPDNVTIFGESGGAGKVSTLIVMPACAGLFHKAIVQSGSHSTALSLDASTALAEKILAGAGLNRSNWKQLLVISTARLVSAFASDLALVQLGPVADGVTITQTDLLKIAPPDGGRVPMIIGTTNDEARLLFASDQAAFSTDRDGLRIRVSHLLKHTPEEADRLIAAYVAAHPGASPPDLYFIIATDIAMRNRAVHQAEYRVAAGGPVYMYRFDWRSPLFGGKYGAVHGIDIPFVFDRPNSLGAVGDNPARFALADAVSKAWAHFARTGEPNHSDLPDWPRYTPTERWTMHFDAASRAVAVPPIVRPFAEGTSA